MVYIVILNWNGFLDTIECIKSLLENVYYNFKIVLIDNNSTNNSITELDKFIDEGNLHEKIHFIKNSENSGFAKGCNIGIRYALENKDCEYIWLLNNDTTVEVQALQKMVKYMNSYGDVDVLTPQINYYSDKEIVWNCGGKISRLGFRRYFYENKHQQSIKERDIIKITFITNCASFFRRKYFENNKIDERFFFGEEDFSMSLNNLKEHKKMICLLDAKVYHKVSRSSSINSIKNENKYFVHYMNRFIDMKLFFASRLVFGIYFSLYSVYLRYLLRKSVTDMNLFLEKLRYAVRKYNEVSKQTFETITKNGYKSFE